MPDLSKQFRTKKHKKPVVKFRDGARWIVSDEALAKIEQMRKEERDKKIAAARLGRSDSGLHTQAPLRQG